MRKNVHSFSISCSKKKRLHKLKCENSKAKPTEPPERWPVFAKDVHVRCKPVCMENTALQNPFLVKCFQ